eukprot:maker-scaffold193_size270907-snap-gene-1.21 protein:Tk01093 transcript:maker-scaffold193_size270907-snap-gene-1.21-mRNA-1 annotation:"histidine-rich membrane protein ke4 homolog 2-like"
MAGPQTATTRSPPSLINVNAAGPDPSRRSGPHDPHPPVTRTSQPSPRAESSQPEFNKSSTLQPNSVSQLQRIPWRLDSVGVTRLPSPEGPTQRTMPDHVHGRHDHSHGGHGHSHGPAQPELTPHEREKHRARLHREWDDDDEEHPSKSDVWIQALLSTLAISLAPFVILFFFNLDNSKEKQGQLKVLLSFASGGLLGDAFLHLIPHAIMAQEARQGDQGGHGHSHGSHGHSHDGEGHSHDMTVGLGVLGGILAFLVVEKVVRIYSDGGHGHSHGGDSKPKEVKNDSEGKTKKESPKKKDKKSDDETEESKSKDDEKKKDQDKKEPQVKEVEEVRVAGYLNLFADFFHNFTDGLAIGASFLAGRSIGWVTTFTILFHEIPHEIGDYAILIQSGVKPFKAKCLQLLTAVGAFAGCVCSLLAEGVDETVTAFILPFTAGGFIYIATVSVIPELLEGATLKQSIVEILALLAGVLMMVIIAQYE